MLLHEFNKIVAKGLRRNLVTEVNITEEAILFSIDADSFYTNAIISCFEPEPNQFAVKVAFSPCDSGGVYLNFTHTPYNDLLLFCNRLAQSLNWCALSPLAVDENSVGMSMSMTLDTDIEDVEAMATSSPQKCRLLRGLIRILEEVEMLYPVLYGISTGQISDLSNIEYFLPDRNEGVQ